MQVTRATFIPLLAPGNTDRIDPAAVREEFAGGLSVVYSFGPQFGRRVVTHADLEQMDMPPHGLRRAALEHLEVLAGRAEFHGQPPALMLSFEGLESSLLLATDFWTRLQGAVPGEIVVGVPARDVVVVTGSQSQAGLEKARRCVERIFFAGDDHLLSRTLLIRRGTTWEPFDRQGPARRAPRPHGPARPHRGPDQMPRQYQEHPSWPAERVPVNRPVSGTGVPPQRMPGVPVGPGPHGPVPVGPVSSGPVGAGRPRGAHHAGPAHTGTMPPVGRPAPNPMTMTGTGGLPPVTGPGGLPPVTGPGGLPPVTGRGGLPPVMGPGGLPPMSTTNTGGLPPVSMTSTGGLPPVRDDRPADVAQYSAVPYSAMPYSAVPYSAMPYSPAPYPVAPQSLAPNSSMDSPYLQSRGARGPQPQQHTPAPKPRYRDDAYSTGARPLYSYEPSYRDEPYREPERDEPYRGSAHDQSGYARPAYPDSWGTPPSSPRPAFTTGPRARFSR